MSDAPALADDLLTGAREIAAFIYGSPSRANVRRVYYLVETSRIPIFRLGGALSARKSVLLAWIEAQERESVARVA
ncbi:DNA-binding protein [Methylopila henanensis]|uniref:DNA-binding protein n=1 Tax=Methylopila henanensis TaxID=873516 RepID=A0ABW4K3L7_9HYPH